MDTHLLRIRDDEGEQKCPSEKIVPRSDASISVGAMPIMYLLAYITDALTTAEFREMSSNEFMENYLAPLDTAIKQSTFNENFLLPVYRYPFGDAMYVEDDIQRYFGGKIADSLHDFYCDIGGMHHFFGEPSIIRPRLERRSVLKPDIAHILKKGSFRNLQIPEVCFAIGDYKKGAYNLARDSKN